MRRTPLFSSLLASLVVVGLGGSSLAEAAPPPQVPHPPPPQAAARRFIAVLAPGKKQCEPVSGFNASSLFTNTKSAHLKSFCVYSSEKPQPFKQLAGDFTRVDPDFDVVLPQAPSASPRSIRDALADAYLASLGSFAGTATQSIYTSTQPLPRIAIIDTAASRVTGQGAVAEHGRAMASIAELARCPQGESGCQKRTDFYQAFPNQDETTDTQRRPALAVPNHGLGSLGTIAEAIERASFASLANKEPLVINLSLGWDPALLSSLSGVTYTMKDAHTKRLKSSPDKSTPAPVQAVHAALLEASCRGALVIAAAGNNVASACEEIGPMEPAAWEALPAPTPGQCATLQGANGGGMNEKPAGRLVYAAGGVTPGGDLLPISRIGGTPPRVLPAFMAAVKRGGRLGATISSWTGTSVAAAALSGLAAAAWTYRPDWKAHQVMAWLDSTGVATELPVDFGARLPNQKAVLIRAGKVSADLCASGSAPYCGSSKFPPWEKPLTYEAASAVVAAAFTAAADGTPDAATGSAVQLPAQSKTSRCGATVSAIRYLGNVIKAQPIANIPFLGLPGPPEPWARPQPQSPICPSCPIKGGKLLLSINPDHKKTLTTGEEGKLRLKRPTLEFLVAKGSYARVTLPDVELGESGLEVDLAPYRVRVGEELKELVSVLNSPDIEAGILTVVVDDVTGEQVSVVSVIPVLH